jgi:hypothetical protein
MFSLRLDEDAVADQVECLVLGGGFPAHLSGAGFNLDDCIQHVLPGAHGNHRVAVPQINTGEAQVHGRLPSCFVHSDEQPDGFGLVLGFEAGEGFGGVVKGVINAFATEE